MSSTYASATVNELIAKGTTVNNPRFYRRYGNANSNHAAKIIASLEGGEAGMLTASGMGAVSLAVLSHVKAGDHVICQTIHYGSALTLFEEMLPAFGVASTVVDQTDITAFTKAIRPNTKLIYLETPVNPLLTITDLRSIAQLAKRHKIITMIDNTFATPINQNPISLGIDIVIHSATKAVGGHSDILAGAIVGTKKLISKMWNTSIVLGCIPGPFDSWLLVRGLKTLHLRVNYQNNSAFRIATYLQAHPKVKKVYYPGLKTHPQHRLAKRQMSGFGGILSFTIKQGYVQSEKFVRALHYFKHAPSLGGAESLVIHPVAMLTKAISDEEFASRGVEKGLIRMSVGLEDVHDLIDDLERAFKQI